MQIDKFGKFPYILVKLSDRVAGNKLIVRGKNGRTEPQLVSAVSQEVRCASKAGPAGMLQRLKLGVYGACCDFAHRGCTYAPLVPWKRMDEVMPACAAHRRPVPGRLPWIDAPPCTQVLNVTARGRFPQASVTLMGSGLMEWSRERDRVINVSAGMAVTRVDGSIHSREDVARLTAALTRASLPMHTKVILESERAAQ